MGLAASQAESWERKQGAHTAWSSTSSATQGCQHALAPDPNTSSGIFAWDSNHSGNYEQQLLQTQQILEPLNRFWSLQTVSRTDKLLTKCSNAFGIFEQPLRLGPNLRAKEGQGASVGLRPSSRPASPPPNVGWLHPGLGLQQGPATPQV